MRTFGIASVLISALVVAACGDGGGTNDLTQFPPVDPPGGPTGTGSDGGGPGPGPFGGGDASGLGDAKPDACAASVAQVQKAKVDLIFVIDNSGSMTAEMTQIKVNVNNFAQKIGMSGLDYRVVFIVAKATSPTRPAT